MAFLLEINGVDYTANFVLSSVRINEGLQVNGQSMSITIQLSGALAAPVGGNVIKFYRDTTLEFAGRIVAVDQVQPSSLHSSLIHYQLECVDWTADLDQKLIQIQYDPFQLAGDIVKSIVANVGKGFTSNNVVNGPEIDGVKIDLEPASSVITRIAEAIEHQWYVDYERDVNFFYILERPAPITSIDFDTNIVDAFDVEIAEHVEHVKNVIYLTGATIKSQNTDYIKKTGDGETRFFPLNYQPWALEDTFVKLDGIYQSLLLDSVDGQAGDGAAPISSAYLCIDNWGVRFPDGSPPALNADVEIIYNYAFEPVVLVEDEDSIAAMKLRENVSGAPSDGRHEFKFHVPDLRVEDESTIVDYGQLLLARYKDPAYVVTFSSWTQGWKPGQVFSGSSAIRGLTSQNLYVMSVGKQILTKKKDGPATDTPAFVYTITASSVPFPQ